MANETVDLQSEAPKFLVTEGTRALDDKMKPSDVGIGRYVIPGALGHSEHEDIAARILWMGREQGQFVAPSWPALAGQVVEELKEFSRRGEEQMAMSEGRNRVRAPQPEMGVREGVNRSVKDWCQDVNRSVKDWVFGFFKEEKVAVPLSESAAQEPPVVEKAQERPALPFSVIVTSMLMGAGANLLANEIHDMIEKGYLKLIHEGNTDYLEPTEKMMREIMHNQSVR